MAFSFRPLTPDCLPEWDAFVAANPHAWPGQDSAIIRFEELRVGARALCHLALDEAGRVAAVIPLFMAEWRRARGLMRWRVLQNGSSLRGGPLLRADLSSDARRAFWAEWRDWIVALARRERADEIRLSMPNFLGDRPIHDVEPSFPLAAHGFCAAAAQTLVLDLAAAPDGPLRAGYDKSCCASLRQAERAGATVEPVTNRETWLACLDLARQTYSGETEPPPSRELMEWIWDGFVARGLADVFGVRHQGALIGVAATVGTRHSRYYWLCFNRKPRPLPGANNMLLDAILEHERSRGTRWMELGSLETDDPRQRGISAFKQSFGGQARPAMGGGLILSKAKQAAIDMLGALTSRLRRKA
jgi:hypothetical protein